MPVYFDDIPLGTDPDIMRAFLGKYLPVERIHYFDWMTSIPPIAGHFVYSGLPYPRISIGSVNWPSGVCQFGVAAFVASQYEVNFFRNSIYANGYARDGTLLVSDGEDEQEFTMRLLPPVPLAQIYGETDFSRSVSAGFPAGTVPDSSDFTSLLTGSTNAEALKYGNLWLLIFVDKRYFWWRRWPDFSDLNSTYTWTWSNVFQRLGNATSGLDCTISANEPHPAYGLPSEQLKVSSIPGPLLAEAIARASGQIAWVSPDGTLNFTRAGNAIILSDDLWDTYSDRLVAGGRIRVAKRVCAQPWLSYDQIGLFPEYVDVHFQKKRGASVTLDTYKSSVEVTSNLPPEAYQGFEGTNTGDRQQLMASLLAETNGSTITNQTALDQCAVQMTKDWLIMQMSATHATFAGVCPIDGTPFDDICWVHSLSDDGGSKIVTRVTRSPINEINSGSPSVALAVPPANAIVQVTGASTGSYYPGRIVRLLTTQFPTTTSTSTTSTTTTTYCLGDPTSSTTSTTSTTTTTGCPTSTTSTTTSTTTSLGTTTSSTTTTTPAPCARYPSVGDGSQDCWIAINNAVDGPVPTDGTGIYAATYAGNSNDDGLPIYVVSDVCSLGATTTTPQPGCRGTCRWLWDSDHGIWTRQLECCDELRSDVQCSCEYPDFCGTEECNETITQCTDRAPTPITLRCPTSTSTTTSTADPDCFGICQFICQGTSWAVYDNQCANGDCGCITPEGACVEPALTWSPCGSTTTSTSTSTTTSEACTGRCLWGYFYGWIPLDGGCWGAGCTCAAPAGVANLCELQYTECSRVTGACVACEGQCDWRWYDLDDPHRWILVSHGCSSATCCAPCNCPYPSIDGQVCGQPITTNCGCPNTPGGGDTTLPNPTSSTSTSTTCAPGTCCGYCYWRWDAGTPQWVLQGPDVNCQGCNCTFEPPYDGTVECEIAAVVCETTTTSSTTTSTSTSTTTTCGPCNGCATNCNDCCYCYCVWNGSVWLSDGPCRKTCLDACPYINSYNDSFCAQCDQCDCSAYSGLAGVFIGQQLPGSCDGTTTTPEPTTTSTTTAGSSSTTTTTTCPCWDGPYQNPFCYVAGETMQTDCIGGCGGTCTFTCGCIPNDPICLWQVTSYNCTGSPSTTSSTTTTDCGSCVCIYVWDGATWNLESDCTLLRGCAGAMCSCPPASGSGVVVGNRQLQFCT